jgi:hypothetical protein
VLSVETSGIIRSSSGCEDQSSSWVRRKGRDREQDKEDLLAEIAEKNYMLHPNLLESTVLWTYP